jgi:hypothetical protein
MIYPSQSVGDKLNLVINIASASKTDMVLVRHLPAGACTTSVCRNGALVRHLPAGACSTSACRSGAHELTATLAPADAAPASPASVARRTKLRVDVFWML